MRHPRYLLALAILAGSSTSAAEPTTCPIPGDLLHWQADYCMAEIGTDDVIAAGPCLEREAKIRFRSTCNGKFRYKGAMCKLAIRAGSYTGSVESCIKDPLFVGPTVRNDGA